MSSHRATPSSSAAFVVVATTTSSVSPLLRCRSIICAMTGFPASGTMILPGKRDDVIRASMVATTFFPLIIRSCILYHVESFTDDLRCYYSVYAQCMAHRLFIFLHLLWLRHCAALPRCFVQ